MELIHKQPVRWTHDRVVACDGGGGGGGPGGHPRIFINTDKPEIAVCNYCGLPFVSVSGGLRYGCMAELTCEMSSRRTSITAST